MSAFAGSSGAQTAYSEQVNHIATAYHDVFGFAGTVKVVKGGEEIYKASFGDANREFDVPNSPSHRVSINSVSKVFTAAAVLKLAEAGKVSLHTPIAQYLPELKASWRDEVTLHHLLTHTSGLPRESGIASHQSLTFEQQIAMLIEQQSLLFTPGERYEYSNAGITLLGRIVENVSKVPFSEFIAQQILEPLKLPNTGVYTGNTVVERQVTPYHMTPDGVSTAQRTKHLGDNAGGGMYSTVDDLYRFVVALESYQLLNEAITNAMFAAHIQSQDGDSHGYGWTLKPFGDGMLRFAAGSGYGTKSVMVRSPDTEDFIAITSNWGNTPILPLMGDIFMAINDLQYAIPDTNMLPSADRYQPFLGRYVFKADELQRHLMMDSNIVTLQSVDGKLFLNDELLAKKPDDKLGLTYTNELTIAFKDQQIIIEINGNTLVGTRR
ncbi:serine hydrolase domain-containing protein [Alteromonas gilva]|uniref:Serine hydrolase n=1 Tax=Alteromonas gilva TaxID=2987522 RepID=A0ABT5L4L5_9ALTE|nr:serine hydrolase domain-containing protein [Alteromonas gilva]MDC8831993.1 serine hydrolase [Alteromonas gilva]